MGFPRQEYWSGLPLLSPGDLPDPEIKPTSLALTGGFFTTEPPGAHIYACTYLFLCTSYKCLKILMYNFQNGKIMTHINNNNHESKCEVSGILFNILINEESSKK